MLTRNSSRKHSLQKIQELRDGELGGNKTIHQTNTDGSVDPHELSIVIVSWNTREVLRECLESTIHKLGDCKAEIIVVDNNSEDGSQAMVEQDFPHVRLIANAENRGFAAANNQAFPYCSGRYILLLNSDTVVLGNVLSDSVRYMDVNADVGVMGCRVLNTDKTVQLTCSRFPTHLNLLLLASGLFRLKSPKLFGRYQIRDWNRDSERDVDTVTGCYMLVRRDAMEEVGVLDESFFFYGEETDWCKRFLRAGWRLRFVPVGEIIHHGSISSRQCNHRRDLMLTEGILRFHRKHGGRFAALAAWFILASFNLTRACYWSVCSLFSQKPKTIDRRDHFMDVVKGFSAVWPTTGGQSS